MRKFSPLLLLSTLALAQVGLVDGPRPSTEVRGTLQGNAREGYSVVVEFLVETGADPIQGSTYQTLGWNGRLYLCISGCDYFTLSGYTPNTPYNGAVFDLYDSQNRLRGRASVSTVYDSQNRPSYHQVQYAVWPLQGAKTWMPSPDNPVPLEAGGWLSARPPGGSARERYRYPRMESYRPPSVQGSILSGISPADRDVVKKSVLSSLADLRSFYARQPRGSTLWFFVPEVSVWTQTLAQEFRARNGGQERFVVPEGKAREYCSLYRNDSRFHVMPRESLAKEQSFAVIYPPSGSTQKGAVMAGRYLVDRPDWQETDYLSFTTPLSPTQEGLPEARATVWGYYSQGLQARVEFKEMQLTSGGYVKDIVLRGDPPYRFTADMGIGEETFTVQNLEKQRYAVPSYFTVVDSQGRYRGTFALTEILYENTGNYTVDYNQPINYSVYRNGYWVPIPPNGVSVGISGETFTTRNCQRTGFRGYRNGEDFFVWEKWSCELQDARGRLRGAATLETTREPTDPSGFIVSDISGYYYPLVPERRVVGFRGNASLLRWVAVWRPATDNDRPVEAGGYVTAEGKRYRVPGLEGYLMPTGKDLEVAEGDPYVSYITRSISPDRAPLGGTGRTEAKVWFKPLSEWCRERGL